MTGKEPSLPTQYAPGHPRHAQGRTPQSGFFATATSAGRSSRSLIV